MDLSHPIADIIPGHRGALLATLVRLREPVTGRELAAHAGVPAATAWRIIDDLAEAGLVHLKPTGRAITVTLNRGHLAVPALEQLSALRSGLIARLKDELRAWSSPSAAAWLFGSAARGDGGRTSDIDIAIVARGRQTTAWGSQIDDLAQLVEHLTGNHAQILDYSAPQFRQLVKSQSPLVRSLRVDAIELVDGSASLLGRLG